MKTWRSLLIVALLVVIATVMGCNDDVDTNSPLCLRTGTCADLDSGKSGGQDGSSFAGNGGSGGTSGNGGSSGQAGTSGNGGTAGNSGTSGTGGNNPDGGIAGQAGNAGTGGSGGSAQDGGLDGQAGTSGNGGSNPDGGTTCSAMQCNLNGKCYDFMTSSDACGATCQPCTVGTTCYQGVCVKPCAYEKGYQLCGEICTKYDNNPQNCGVCGNTCTAGTTCVDGHCTGSIVNCIPSTEVCDGQDNDCDGQADEGCECNPGALRACGKSSGQCKYGSEACDATGHWSGICIGATTSTPEVCDGIDNDCDGNIDNVAGAACQCFVTDSPIPCGNSNKGECRLGIRSCTASGQWGACVGNVDPVVETCDGKDNNCDGATDEGCNCQHGKEQLCGTSDVGECRKGKQTCQDNGQWGPCVGNVDKSAETCDGLDNDCNGTPDDGLANCECQDSDQMPCGVGKNVGQCRYGTKTCTNHKWGACIGAIDPIAETCDKLDNDCDGVVDNTATPCVCIPGDSVKCGTSDVGECKKGTQKCKSDGTWDSCVGNIEPSTEICDGLDNNCDGSTDEGVSNCSCKNGATKTCGSNVGQCRLGQQVCNNNVWSSCTGGINPGTETCGDEIDNDCNGQADDGCDCTPGDTLLCGHSNIGQCRKGTQTCGQDGHWGTCVGNVDPSTEICDGLDNDCDGSADEGVVNCLCQNGATKVCGSAKGTCKQGQQTCTNNMWSACVGNVDPVPDVCDGLDNDCDGITDNGAVSCVCVNGSTRPCGSSVGECKPGTQACTAGQWGACIGSTGPTPEICDGKDNDCNGLTDDQLASCYCSPGLTVVSGSNVGECRQGYQVCGSDGKWGTQVGGVQKSVETCDGKDNDCDGTIDNAATACVCVNGSTMPCGSSVGECKSGTQTCTNGQWGSCIGSIGPTNEVCADNKDNNCNGIVDDGCSSQVPSGTVYLSITGCYKQWLVHSGQINPTYSSSNDNTCQSMSLPISYTPGSGDSIVLWALGNSGTVSFSLTLPTGVIPTTLQTLCSSYTTPDNYSQLSNEWTNLSGSTPVANQAALPAVLLTKGTCSTSAALAKITLP